MKKSENPFPSIMTNESYAAMQARMTWDDICRKAHEHTVKMQPMIDAYHRAQRIIDRARNANPVLGY